LRTASNRRLRATDHTRHLRPARPTIDLERRSDPAI
jgi:hypothetical protein